MQTFYSPGKLLISGEYLVLDGASALALPTRYGQSLELREIKKPVLKWKSLDHQQQIWIEEEFSIDELLKPNHPKKAELQEDSVQKRLFSLLQTAVNLKPDFFKNNHGYELTSRTNFPFNWGLGSSSTLISNLAKWLEIDAYVLLEETFGGSGYDVAVALHGQPIVYQLSGGQANVLKVEFNPPFKDSLFFVHLNKKQNSRASIKHYRKQHKEEISRTIEKISGLSFQMINCRSIEEFELLMEIHESIISGIIGLSKVKTELFPDYPGAIKSLGGWGGDFVMATGSENMEYFKSKGYKTILSFDEMILNNL